MRFITRFSLVATGLFIAACGAPTNDLEDDPDDSGVPDARPKDGQAPKDAGDAGTPDDGGPDCGDGVKGGLEECDGPDLGGQDCESAGFTAGTLGCTAACKLDVSDCYQCGDGVRGGPEACDGADLNGQSCALLGHTAGTLACSTMCTYDESLCTDCGDGIAEGDEGCDGADLKSATCTSLPGGFTGGVLACTSACGYDTIGCTTPISRPSTPGQIVITEMMPDPNVGGSDVAEWFEVLNTTTEPLDLSGCVFRGAGSIDDAFTVATLVIAPGEYATFAQGGVPASGFTPSYVWPSGGFELEDVVGDEITLDCGGATIDSVDYGAPFFQVEAGTSTTLWPMVLTANANDKGYNWCFATSSLPELPEFDKGTPNAANDACALYTIGVCRLQSPTSIVSFPDSWSTVFGQVHVQGLTDRTTGIDPHVNVLLAEFGYGPDGSDPATSTAWTWTTAPANPAYGPQNPRYEENFDEYQLNFMYPAAAGTYDYAFRFSGTRGGEWTVCDSGPLGSRDGYQTSNAGDLQLTTPNTLPNLYFSEYIETPINNSIVNNALEVYNAGTDSVDLSKCTLTKYQSPNTPTSVIARAELSGTLDPGKVVVLCPPENDDPECMLRLTSTFASPRATKLMDYNGNDGFKLSCYGATMDIIGMLVGPLNFPSWGTPPVKTADHILHRKCSVTQGDRIEDDAFIPAVEWDGFAPSTPHSLGDRNCPPP